MEPAKDIIERLHALESLTEKNHQLLLKIRRVQRNGHLFRLFYWLVIIGLGLGAFYYIQPYIEQLINTYNNIDSAQQNFKQTLPDIKYLDELLNQIGTPKN